MDAREMKVKAAEAALGYVEDGMRLGIGTGSTAEEFVRLLAEKVHGGLKVLGVPTSERTARLCVELGVPLKSLDELPELDLTIDGTDEVDGNLTLIKGGGGALLREKIVAAKARSWKPSARFRCRSRSIRSGWPRHALPSKRRPPGLVFPAN
jgi:ribose 5-phosphate isomerase A